MLGDVNEAVAAELDVRRHCHSAYAYDAEQAFDEAIVVGHEEHNFVVSANAETGQSRCHLLGSRFQLGIGQGDFALFDDPPCLGRAKPDARIVRQSFSMDAFQRSWRDNHLSEYLPVFKQVGGLLRSLRGAIRHR